MSQDYLQRQQIRSAQKSLEAFKSCRDPRKRDGVVYSLFLQSWAEFEFVARKTAPATESIRRTTPHSKIWYI